MTDKLSLIAADNYRLARSGTLYELADGTYNLIRLPKYSFIDGVWLYITQAYAGGATGTATIGFVGNGETADPDGFLDSTAAGAEATGYKFSGDDGQPASQGKWFSDAGGMITITLSKGTHTTLMIGYVFARYTVIR